VNLDSINMTGWNFAGQDLTDASLCATLTGADFTGATVVGARLYPVTQQQLASTASYQAHDLRRINLTDNTLTGWDLSEQDLTGANLTNTRLTGADLSGAVIKGVDFRETTGKGLTRQQIAGTASYQAHDLSGIGMYGNDLSGWDLSGQDLTGANLINAVLTGTDFSGAIIKGALLSKFDPAGGFTEQQLVSTASYQAGDLSGISFANYDVSGWDFSEQNLTGAVFTRAKVKGTDFTDAVINDADFSVTSPGVFTMAQLASTASYKSGNLRGINLSENILLGWDFSGQDLTGADFHYTDLTDADFTDAIIRDADFSPSLYQAIITEQMLADTASYKLHDLRGIRLETTDLSGWDLSGQDLSGASFRDARLHATDFSNARLINAELTAQFKLADMTGADTRGATDTIPLLFATAYTRNMIFPDGSVPDGLYLGDAESMWVRDYDAGASADGDALVLGVGMPVVVFKQMRIDAGGTLRFVFEDHSWGSPIRFDNRIEAALLGGTLELVLSLDDGLLIRDLIGSEFQLFDWTDVLIDGEFARIVVDPAFSVAGLSFDTSRLYSTGVVRVVPEPVSFGIWWLVVAGAFGRRPRRVFTDAGSGA
jgi:uncharacterized protein YjbI with pentapeptide repeats